MLDCSVPRVMGILNITPDSVSDGGQLFRQQVLLDAVIARALQMQADGAAILDVGGESTRPGAEAVGEQEELDRVIPVIEALRLETSLPISIDSSKAAVMQAAITAGATFINDVRALQQPDALWTVAAAARTNPALQICLMHMQGTPRTMQQAPAYGNVVAEVVQFLQQRVMACEQAGIARDQLVLDPGFGFGKSLEHNLVLLKNLHELEAIGCPLLVGLSRKSMVSALTGRKDPSERLAGSLALAWAALQQGAKILRVHDVKETVDFLKVMAAL